MFVVDKQVNGARGRWSLNKMAGSSHDVQKANG